jgi:hypothetical protein
MLEVDINSPVQFVIIDPSTVVPILLFFYRSPSSLEIPLPSPLKRGRPNVASLFVPWGRPDVASLFVPWGRPDVASLLWYRRTINYSILQVYEIYLNYRKRITNQRQWIK